MLTVGSFQRTDYKNSKLNGHGATFSYEKGRFGFRLGSAEEYEKDYPVRSATLELLLKFKISNFVIKAQFLDYQFVSIPKFVIVSNSSLGDNLMIKNEYSYPSQGSFSYFGYSHSRNLFLGVGIRQLEEQNRSEGFFKRPFKVGFVVKYRE